MTTTPLGLHFVTFGCNFGQCLDSFGPFWGVDGLPGRFLGGFGAFSGFRGGFWRFWGVFGFPWRFSGDFRVSGAVLGRVGFPPKRTKPKSYYNSTEILLKSFENPI